MSVEKIKPRSADANDNGVKAAAEESTATNRVENAEM
jgi:hypothetical protein